MIEKSGFFIFLFLASCTASNPVLCVMDMAAPPDLAPVLDGAQLPDTGPPDILVNADLAVPPDLAPLCAGYVDPKIPGCWYVGSHASCNSICRTHGGFDAINSVHYGDPILKHFYPNSKLTNTTGYIEWCTIESGVMYRWPANGLAFSGATAWDYDCVACSCNW